MKAYSKYKESGNNWIKNIPEHWSILNLKRFSSLVNGSTPQSATNEYWDGDIVWVTPTDLGGLNGNKIISNSTRKITELGLNNCGASLTPKGSIILSTRAPIGHLALTDVQSCTNQGCKTIVPDFSRVNNVYLYYYLFVFKEILQSLGQGSTFVELSSQNLKDFISVLPPLLEQQTIADFLDHKTTQIDTLIEKKQQQIDLLQEEHKALIIHAITKGTNPNVTMKDSGVEWLDEIPSHWEFVKTKYLFRLVTEKAPDDNDMELLSLYTEIGVRPRKDLEARGNKASTTDGYWIVKEGDIIINKLLAWMGAVGYSAYDGVTSPAYDILRKTVPLNSKFYHYLLRCGVVLPEFKRRSRGIMEMRLRLYFDELGQIPLVYPPESEQNQIVEYLEDLEENVNRTMSKITKEIELLQEYRMALIFESVTGKIDVRTAV